VTVERGFRFLKDPMFYAESLYLKSPKRIMALIMVMTLSGLVYALAEQRVHSALAEANEHTPGFHLYQSTSAIFTFQRES
jgi:transposase